jgi:hypothetical protein
MRFSVDPRSICILTTKQQTLFIVPQKKNKPFFIVSELFVPLPVEKPEKRFGR